MKTVTITIPVLNEEETLREQVSKAHRFIQDELSDLASIGLLIADNGSHDQTLQIGQALAAELDGVSFLRVSHRGVGLALKESWNQSTSDIVGYMDLDLATDLRHLREALTPLIADDADVVTGSRLLPQSRVINRSPMRAVVSRVFNAMLSTYLGVKFSDGMCGFKFLQRKHFARLRALGAKSDGWFFATELLVCAEAENLRVVDLPVQWTDDPKSKAKIGKLAVEYLKAMRALKLDLKQRKSDQAGA